VRTRVFILLALLLSGAVWLRAADVIPPPPTRYFNDYALTVKPETADALNRQLEDFEKQTGTQLLVAIFPKLQTETDLADYTHRMFAVWRPGQEGKNNGAVLFVFVQDHKMRIETGRGLEGALPDARCRQIIGDVIAPKFRAGDYDGGLQEGVAAMIAAVQGEDYKGTGRTAYQQQHPGGQRSTGGGIPAGFLVLIFLAIFLFVIFVNRRQSGPRGGMYSGGGFSPIFLPFGGGGGGGGSWSSGGGSSSSSSDDGGGFFSSGGGDSGGGGGASGDW